MMGGKGFEAAETVFDGGHGWRWKRGAFLGENLTVQRLDGVEDAMIAKGTVMMVEQAATAD